MKKPSKKEKKLDLSEFVEIGQAYEPPELHVSAVRDRPKALPVVVACIGEREIYRDRLDLHNMKKRERATTAIAEQTGLTPEVVDAEFIKAATTSKGPPDESERNDSAGNREALLKKKDERVQQLLDETPEEIREAALTTLRGRPFATLTKIMSRLGVTGEELLCQLLWVVCCSSKLERPLAQLIEGTSSSGKSYTIDCVKRLVPPEASIEATDLTPTALYYFKPGQLIHAVVVGGESTHGDNPERREARKAFREMISAGELRKALPIKTSRGGFETHVVHQPGPIAYVESTTSLHHLDENVNRMLRIASDDSPEQTRAVIREAGKRHAAQAMTEAVEFDVEVFRTMFRMMKRVEVVIPFAEPLSEAIAEQFGHLTEARRTYNHIANTIKTIALSRQYRRVEDPEHGMPVEANLNDYIRARKLLGRPLGLMLGVTGSAPAFRFGRRLWDKHGKTEFTAKDCGDQEVTHKSKRLQYLGVLADHGYAEIVRPATGPYPATWQMLKPVPSTSELTVELPSPEELK